MILLSGDQTSRIAAEAYRLARTLPIRTSQLTASRAAQRVIAAIMGSAMSWR